MAQTAAQKKAAAAKATAAKATAAKATTETASADVTTGTVELLRKITNKTVLGKEFLSNKPETDTELYTLMGVISGYKADTSEYGDFIKFRGDFVAVVKHNGKEYRAPGCIVPVPMDDVLAGMYDKAVGELVDPETGELPAGKRASCQFAVTIGYKPGDTPTGYEWTVTPLIKMQENDAITSLKSQLLALENKQ